MSVTAATSIKRFNAAQSFGPGAPLFIRRARERGTQPEPISRHATTRRSGRRPARAKRSIPKAHRGGAAHALVFRLEADASIHADDAATTAAAAAVHPLAAKLASLDALRETIYVDVRLARI